ncbi:MAG: hypothetical protein HWN68_08890 [Desulfobacterales bacterium]|nr:hypothetical protein [Desulfobacterales bacterium]
MSELIELTGETITLYADTPKGVGSTIDFEVKLPEGILLKSFMINGTITACESVRHNGSCNYMIQMRLGEISPINKMILEAYIDFLERDNMLKKITMDFGGLQEALDDFMQNVSKLAETAEQARDNIRGTLELARRNSEGETTIH